MSNEDIKKVLVQYKRVSNMIRHIEDEIAQIDDKVLGIRENQMTGMPKGSSSLTTTDMLVEKRDLEMRLEKFKKAADQKREIVQAYIDTVLSPKHNDILTMYYIKGYSIEKIARIKHYTVRHGWRLYDEALTQVDMTINL